jgi:hypothetical protein
VLCQTADVLFDPFSHPPEDGLVHIINQHIDIGQHGKVGDSAAHCACSDNAKVLEHQVPVL